MPTAVFAASQRSPTAMRRAAAMIRMLGAIVGAAGKADMFVNRPLATLGLETFRIAPGHRTGPRSLTDRLLS